MTNIPPCPIGQHIEEFRYRWHIMHICFSNGPAQPYPVDWPIVWATAIGIALISAALVYFGGILIVAYLYRKAEAQK